MKRYSLTRGNPSSTHRLCDSIVQRLTKEGHAGVILLECADQRPGLLAALRPYATKPCYKLGGGLKRNRRWRSQAQELLFSNVYAQIGLIYNGGSLTFQHSRDGRMCSLTIVVSGEDAWESRRLRVLEKSLPAFFTSFGFPKVWGTHASESATVACQRSFPHFELKYGNVHTDSAIEFVASALASVDEPLRVAAIVIGSYAFIARQIKIVYPEPSDIEYYVRYTPQKLAESNVQAKKLAGLLRVLTEWSPQECWIHRTDFKWKWDRRKNLNNINGIVWKLHSHGEAEVFIDSKEPIPPAGIEALEACMRNIPEAVFDWREIEDELPV
jgi:hypothetical protein